MRNRALYVPTCTLTGPVDARASRKARGQRTYAPVCVSSRHDRLMQTYDVMRFDINIFPLIRQMPGPPPHVGSCHDGKTRFPSFNRRGNFLSAVKRLRSVRVEAPRVDKPRVLMSRAGREIYSEEFLAALTAAPYLLPDPNCLLVIYIHYPSLFL